MQVREQHVAAPEGPLTVITVFDVQPFHNNVYVLVDPPSGECVVIDASEAVPIAAAVQKLNPRTVIITHGHRDHHYQLSELREYVPAPVAIGAADADMLPFPPDVRIEHGDTVCVGPHTLRALATPGHTPGGTCWLVDNLLFSGDTLFPGGPGNTRRESNPLGDFEQIMRSLRTHLFSLPDETQVLPGHGEGTTIGAERPHLEAWQARGW